MPIKMTKIRKSAKGQECMVRLVGVCNGNAETTIFAHFRELALGCGTSHKPNDLFGAYACSSCHDVLDGRSKTAYERDWIIAEFRRAVMYTQKALLDMGLIKLA